MLYNYEALVVKVVDGDTADLMVDLGFSNYTKIRVRLANIDTAELNAISIDERIEANKAKARLTALIFEKKVYFKSKGKDKYGRWVAELFLNIGDEKSVNTVLLEEGLATKYEG